MAVYWSWYCSIRRGGGRIGGRGWNPETRTFGDYPGWRVMRAQPRLRFGVAGGNRGARRKTHMVRDQIVAKHKWFDEQRMTRWLCGAYTFEAILQDAPAMVCAQCLLKAQGRSSDPFTS